MKVNDKRAKPIPKVNFADLPIGQAYEDKDGIFCIKTDDNDGEFNNCIYYIRGVWESDCEMASALVTPLIVTLEIER